MKAIKVLALAVAVSATLIAPSGAKAQQESQPDSGSMMDHQSGGGSMMGHGIMGDSDAMMGQRGTMGGRMGGMGAEGGRPSMCAMMTGHIEGRLAFLKVELNITPEQESLWNDYAGAVSDNAKPMTTRCLSLMSQGGTSGLSLPDRLDAQEQFLAARFDGLRATSRVLKALYGALSATQKQIANELIRSSTGMM